MSPLVRNRYIFIFLLISVALTFNGTEAGCRRGDILCGNMCKTRGNEGLNCCAGTQGGYGENGLFNLYKPLCSSGYCDLRNLNRYVASMSVLFHNLWLKTNTISFFLVFVEGDISVPTW